MLSKLEVQLCSMESKFVFNQPPVASANYLVVGNPTHPWAAPKPPESGSVDECKSQSPASLRR